MRLYGLDAEVELKVNEEGAFVICESGRNDIWVCE